MEVVWLSLDGFDVTFGKRERHPQSICLPSACPLSKQVCRATVFTIDSDSGSLRLARSAAEDSARCKALLIPGMGENSLSGSECYSREWAKTLNQGLAWALPEAPSGLRFPMLTPAPSRQAFAPTVSSSSNALPSFLPG